MRTNLDAVRARVPGFSSSIPARLNLWGEPILLTGGLGPDLVSPIYTNEVVPDFTSEEAVRLKARLTQPQRKMGELELLPQEFFQVSQETGRFAKRNIDKFVSSPYYAATPDPIKREIMEKEYATARTIAKFRLLGQIRRTDPTRAREALTAGTLAQELIDLQAR